MQTTDAQLGHVLLSNGVHWHCCRTQSSSAGCPVSSVAEATRKGWTVFTTFGHLCSDKQACSGASTRTRAKTEKADHATCRRCACACIIPHYNGTCNSGIDNSRSNDRATPLVPQPIMQPERRADCQHTRELFQMTEP